MRSKNIVIRLFSLLYIVFLLASVHTQQIQAATPISLSTEDETLSIAIAASYLTPANWSIPTGGLTTAVTDETQSQGYILYGYNWQPSGAQLIRLQPGSELTVSFADARAKTYTMYNLIALDSRRSDYAQLANDPDTLLIYSSTSVIDPDRLVLVAKLKPDAQVSSL